MPRMRVFGTPKNRQLLQGGQPIPDFERETSGWTHEALEFAAGAAGGFFALKALRPAKIVIS